MTLYTVVHTLTLILAVGCALATLPGTIELALLTFGAVWPQGYAKKRTCKQTWKRTVRLAVVVPAHNEESSIGACVQKIAQSNPGRADIFVVADNCSDQTAAAAQAAGARVLVRTNPLQPGKGAALRYGFGVVFAEGFDAVLVIDADSHPSPGLIDQTRQLLENGCDALQCRYQVANKNDSPRTRLMDLAFMASNVLRPRGRNWLGFSCGILGNGFALHRDLLAAVPYDSDSIVEDLDYHLHLVERGRRVQFLDSATVWGEMPVAREGAASQRARWEGGRLGAAKQWIPMLMGKCVSANWRLVEPLLDLLTLPLAFHAMGLLALAAIPEPWTRIYAAAAFTVVAAHVAVAAMLSEKPLAALYAIAIAPVYMLWKLRIVGSLIRFSGKDASWIRTARIVPEER